MREELTLPVAVTVAPGARAARLVLTVRGVVQGVGFRPFVHREATRLGLAGAVWNDPEGVVIDIEGTPEAVAALRDVVERAPPPRAVIERLMVEPREPTGATGFSIRPSADRAAVAGRVPADLATCARCLAELRDPHDRRHRHPFVNCTDCGPRWTVVTEVPYDRARTTMAGFALCAACAAEYADPASRRFHAEPIACPACGPRLRLGDATGEAALAEAVAALRRGEIVAIKGLGGFHLACDARDSGAIARLRQRKHRAEKPFAVMFPDLSSLGREAVVDEAARAALTSPRRPIVLLPRRVGATLPDALAPGLRELGVFLPATPLHHLILDEVGGPLVMTSGNVTDEPIVRDDDEARRRLGGIADRILGHDRAIHMRCDDSVVRIVAGRERVLRRARGHVPEAIDLGFDAPAGLATGGDLKGAFALVAGGAAILGPHLGDLEHLEAQRFLHEARAHLERLFRVRPTWCAHDLHPGYHSTAVARRTGLPLVAVQHHHAHIAAVLAEHGRRDRVLGVAWDGTGYGSDGGVWGGELLVADLAVSRRIGRLRPVPLAGGDRAVREPWRLALAHLRAAGLPIDRIRAPAREAVDALVGAPQTPVTSSVGRLFDAVASLVGLRDRTTYEGQAAMELEAASDDGAHEPYPLPVTPAGELLELDPRPLVAAVVTDVDRGEPVATIGARFHAALAAALAAACARAREAHRLDTVVLGGGCFANRRLLGEATRRLEAAGFEVLSPARVPPGDGGLALGQATVAAWRARDVSRDPR